MAEFFSFLKFLAATVAIVLIVLFILLAIPSSRLRGVLLKVFGYFMETIATISIIYILNPLDLIPDFIPVIGQIDDLGGVITALFTGITGFYSMKKGKKDLALSKNSQNYIEHK